MIDRQGGRILVECDCCDTVVDTESANWSAVWPSLKWRGWKAEKVGHDWAHFCPDCAEQ